MDVLQQRHLHNNLISHFSMNSPPQIGGLCYPKEVTYLRVLYRGMLDEELSDEQIAQRVKDGDNEAFGLFVERYEKKLTRYGGKFLSRTEDIQDVVQDVFIKAYQNMQSFDASLRFSPWIYRIAHNTFVNELRKNSRRPFFLKSKNNLFCRISRIIVY